MDTREPIGAQLLMTFHATLPVLPEVFVSASAYVPTGDNWLTPVDRSLADTRPGDIPREQAHVELSAEYRTRRPGFSDWRGVPTTRCAPPRRPCCS